MSSPKEFSRSQRLSFLVERCTRTFSSQSGLSLEGELRGMLCLLKDIMGASRAGFTTALHNVESQLTVACVQESEPDDFETSLERLDFRVLSSANSRLADVFEFDQPLADGEHCSWRNLVNGRGMVLPLAQQGQVNAALVLAFEQPLQRLMNCERSCLVSLGHLAMLFTEVQQHRQTAQPTA